MPEVTANGEKWRKVADTVISLVILGIITQGVLLWKEVAVIQSNRWTARDHAEYATDVSRETASDLRDLNATLMEIKSRLAAFSPVDTAARLDKISSQLSTLMAEVAAIKAKAEKERTP